MNGYEPSTPRAALGLSAVAMAAVTIGVLVVLPAKFDSVSAEPYVLGAAPPATEAPTEVAISPACNDAPEVVDHDDHVHPGSATIGAQESRSKRHPSSSRRRTDA